LPGTEKSRWDTAIEHAVWPRPALARFAAIGYR